LSLEELCEERAGRAGAQNEDLHDVAKTVSQTFRQPIGPELTMVRNFTSSALAGPNPVHQRKVWNFQSPRSMLSAVGGQRQ
jgi:hypothetical protein